MVRVNDIGKRTKSNCMRFLFEQGETLVCYDVGPETPALGIVPQPFDVHSQMDADGISLSEIAEDLRRCAEGHAEVENVSLHYTGCRYSVVVVLHEISEETVSEIYGSFEQACQTCGPHRPTITVLGPKQRDCFVLSAADSYRIYSNGDRLKTPAGPPLG